MNAQTSLTHDATPDTVLTGTWSASPVGRVAAPLREQVIDALRAAILDFRLKPGQRLIERELIESLGVSRTTVREALRELTSEGLVRVIPQRGSFVAAPSPEEAADLYEARAAVETLILRQFIDKAGPEDIERLEKAFAGFEAASQSGHDVLDIIRAKDAFTQVLCEGTGSDVLPELTDTLTARIRVLRVKAMSMGHAEAVEEVRAVVEAVKAKDADRAAAIYTAHIRRAKDNALRSLDETQLDGP